MSKIVKLKTETLESLSTFKDLVLNDLNPLIPGTIHIFLNKKDEIQNLKILAKTEFEHIYVCEYFEYQTFFAIFLLKSKGTKGCALEYKHSNKALSLTKWVENKKKQYELICKKEKQVA